MDNAESVKKIKKIMLSVWWDVEVIIYFELLNIRQYLLLINSLIDSTSDQKAFILDQQK